MRVSFLQFLALAVTFNPFFAYAEEDAKVGEKESRVYTFETYFCKGEGQKKSLYTRGQERDERVAAFARKCVLEPILIERKYFQDSKLHREDGPAVEIFSDKTGAIFTERWYREGKLHRKNGPAVISYDESEVVPPIVKLEEWYRDGVRHRDKGPAYTEYLVKTKKCGSSQLITNKKQAKTCEEGIEQQRYLERWYLKGARGRLGGPSEVYYFDGKAIKNAKAAGVVSIRP